MSPLLIVSLVAVGAFGSGQLLTRFFMKRAGMNPSHKGFVVAGLSFAGLFLLYILLKQFGINIFQGNAFKVYQATIFLFFSLCPRV